MSLKERRRRARRISYVLGALLVGVVLMFIATLARIPETKITSISVSDTTYVHAGALEHVAQKNLAGSHFFLIPRTHTFFAPLSSIRREIENSFPAVKRAIVRRDGMRAITISVTEETPAFLWCRAHEGASESCFYMSDRGYVFAPAPVAVPTFVRYAGGIVGDPIGSWFLEESFQDLHKVVEQIARVVDERVTFVSVDVHNDVTVTFASGASLMFVRTAHTETLLDAIASVFSVQRAHERRSLEYADFRFGNRVFVKFHGDE